ncbi:hypothetical protein E2C01_050980 [Portunus trituberculatus]|uniref:Secreted protein n=1 Tax=Portunus trituberculatus TaxID=210409 RepID=A0A5B7GHV1_PORTR|nr:hypothetical protein [Portunus trituberculatus]
MHKFAILKHLCAIARLWLRTVLRGCGQNLVNGTQPYESPRRLSRYDATLFQEQQTQRKVVQSLVAESTASEEGVGAGGVRGTAGLGDTESRSPAPGQASLHGCRLHPPATPRPPRPSFVTLFSKSLTN